MYCIKDIFNETRGPYLCICSVYSSHYQLATNHDYETIVSLPIYVSLWFCTLRYAVRQIKLYFYL